MSLRSIIIPALAIAGGVVAQSTNTCSNSGTSTLQSQGDATALAGCATFTGSIAIQTGVSSDLSLSGIEAITGDLIAANTVNLPSFSAGSLQTIGGTFGLTNMTLLTSLSFPQLSSVGSISWTTLPRLSSLGFGSGVTKANSVAITDSQLASLDGINLQTVEAFTISNNNQLNEIDMQLSSISQSFAVEFNGRNMSISLPNLQVAYNMTFRNVSSISMPSLAGVNDTLGFYGCTFGSLALPNVTSAGGSISFIGNNDLTNITMPQLSTLGGALQLSANPDLDTVNGFPKLSQVKGAVDCNGNFTDVELPALQNVAGACNLQSTANIASTCSHFQNLKSSGVIQGKLVCSGYVAQPSGVGSNPSSTATSSQKGAASHDLYARSSAVTGVLGVFAAMLGML